MGGKSLKELSRDGDRIHGLLYDFRLGKLGIFILLKRK